MELERRPDCVVILDGHEKRIQGLETACSVQGLTVQELKVKLENQTQSMNSLIRAIWGLVASVLVLLGGFLLWVIQYLINQ